MDDKEPEKLQSEASNTDDTESDASLTFGKLECECDTFQGGIDCTCTQDVTIDRDGESETITGIGMGSSPDADEAEARTMAIEECRQDIADKLKERGLDANGHPLEGKDTDS